MSTVGELIDGMLGEDPSANDWALPPASPPDVFAVCASLLQTSGAYQHILAAPGVSQEGLVLLVDDKQRKHVIAAAAIWRRSRMPKRVLEWWDRVRECAGEPVFVPSRAEPAAWWMPAVLLMMTADNASEGIGYGVSEDGRARGSSGKAVEQVPWYAAELDRILTQREFVSPASISRVSTALHCVLPKCRTPSMGVTLRSLSHHMALLPPESIVAARWINRSQEIKDHGPLNLLLVPFPYVIGATSFHPSQNSPGTRWGSFRLAQDWLRAGRAAHTLFVNFVEELIEAAHRQVRQVDAVVLPELALDAPYFEQLSKTLQNSTGLEFLVAGVSEHPSKHQKGNYVATTYYFDETKPGDEGKSERARTVRVRAKHHRWKLDGRQIKRYALGAVLDPTKSWWEDFNIEPREIHVVRFRRNSTLATLICEDLARIDPCQEVIRSIGPSLVLVLLMDGPQLKPRWPARYATVLADDPGSSVLTLTSMGLINRQRSNGESSPSTIALWKDNRAEAVEITLPIDHHAVVLTLTPHEETIHSLDGRPRSGAVSWQLSGMHPIKVPDAQHFDWILTGN